MNRPTPKQLVKPSDARVRAAIERVFDVQPQLTDISQPDTAFRNRELLHQSPLARVERLIFRSSLLPSTIYKATLPPLHNELAIYQDLFSTASPWSATFYGSLEVDDELWLFLEDVGSRTLQTDLTADNVLKVATALAGLHATFSRQLAEKQLRAKSRLRFMDYAAYLVYAEEAFTLTRQLVTQRAYRRTDQRALVKLETIVNLYERVARKLADSPQTLAHGDYKPDNIVLDGPERVVIVDWARAHIGAGLVDLVDLAATATTEFGSEIMPRLLQTYRMAYRSASGDPLDSQSLEEFFLVGQIEKKVSQIRWYAQCSLYYIPSARAVYDNVVSSLISEAYDLSKILF